jgi:hypothetical protein
MPSLLLVIGSVLPTGIQSPERVTSVALGARTRNVTLRSECTSGETSPSGGGVWENADERIRAEAKRVRLIK